MFRTSSNNLMDLNIFFPLVKHKTILIDPKIVAISDDNNDDYY